MAAAEGHRRGRGLVLTRISRTTADRFGTRCLRPGISRHSQRRTGQSVWLGSVRPSNPKPGAAGAWGFSLCSSKRGALADRKPVPSTSNKRMIAMIYNPDDVKSWPYFKPLIIAHDVG